MSRIDRFPVSASLSKMVRPHGDLQRRRVGHPALFAFVHVIFQLQAHRVAALVAEVRSVRVVGAALRAEHIAGMKRVGDDGVSAILTSGAQVMQALQVAALALPVTNGVSPRTPVVKRCGNR